MVEQILSLDTVFSSLSDGKRRDILRRLINQELSIGEIAKPYDITFAAVSKHLKVLEKAQLIIKRRRGKEQIVQLSPQALKNAAEYLENYQLLWDERFQNLDKLLKQMQEE
jgi:DNA-binding transcriptional ArsR family regulator